MEIKNLEPCKLCGGEYRPFGAYADIATHGLLDAAKAGTEAAGPHVLKTHVAGHPGLACPECHGTHHGFRAAGSGSIEMLGAEDAVLGDETAFAEGGVFGGHRHLAQLTETLQLQDVLGTAASEEEVGTGTGLEEGLAILEHGSGTHSTADEEDVASRMDGETVAEGE